MPPWPRRRSSRKSPSVRPLRSGAGASGGGPDGVATLGVMGSMLALPSGAARAPPAAVPPGRLIHLTPPAGADANDTDAPAARPVPGRRHGGEPGTAPAGA